MHLPSKTELTDDVHAGNFDCVGSMRQACDGVGAETASMHYEQVMRWLRSIHYENPYLAELATRAHEST